MLATGSFWLILAHKTQMQEILVRANETLNGNPEVKCIQIDTVEDAEKLTLLIELLMNYRLEDVKSLFNKNPYERKEEKKEEDA